MFNPKRLINFAIQPKEYIWITAALIKETPRAILIEFDGKQIWLPKAWILHVKQNQPNCTISTKISLYHWAKKFQ